MSRPTLGNFQALKNMKMTSFRPKSVAQLDRYTLSSNKDRLC